ncbi:MAG: VCBS repeat-containing protein [Chloroflexi bacterium]|nr:VCBS repeat-containing protein [Chloroflexota bacterium]
MNRKKIVLVCLAVIMLAACGNAADREAVVENEGGAMETAVFEPTSEPTKFSTQIPEPTTASTQIPEPSPTSTPTLEVKEEGIILQKAQEFHALATYNIGLGDLDGDGDLDAVFANMRFNKSRVWLNDGLGNFEQTPQELTTQGHGVGLDDLDGDGDLDAVIVCATFNGNPKPTKIYFNDGSGNFTDSMQDLGDQELSGNEVNLIDIENDGDVDIHVYYYPGKNMIYLNDGKGNFVDRTELMRGTIGWGDLNTDGSIDIFLKDHENQKIYQTFLNDGTGEFTELWQMQDANIAERKVLLGDFDEDGDLDAFTTNGERDQQHPPIVLFNNGDGTFEDSGQSLELTHMAHPIQGDLNGDGYLDIFIANGWMYDQILINDGHGFFTDSGLVLDENLHSTIPSLGDLDMDGDLDIMVGSYESRPDYWFNETNASPAVPYVGQTPPRNVPEIFAPGFLAFY